ncbi:MAG: metal ABC transporter permease [Methylacidiphilales bacterium]|nr:metal ABC transporter permease [Candidatus Methylacidiphilales bacterium]MDW8350171.1 metal ABC transporter permease [Verrucomicrobiae bacterium]
MNVSNFELLWPAYDAYAVWIRPWVEDRDLTLPIFLMAFFVTAGCGLVGNYLLLRRSVLVGDAISHSLLPGIIVVFLLFDSLDWPLLFLSAVVTGVIAVWLAEVLHRQTVIPKDSAWCVTFTSLFALGVLMLSLIERQAPIHLDVECLLFGEIAFVALEPSLKVAGVSLGPHTLWVMAGLCVFIGLLILLFYKELLVITFDETLARLQGRKVGLWHYGMMAIVAVVIVAVLQAVGVILVVAMLILPGMTASELSTRLPGRLLWTLAYALITPLLGYPLAVWWQCTVAGSMVVVGALVFTSVWLIKRWFFREKTVFVSP